MCLEMRGRLQVRGQRLAGLQVLDVQAVLPESRGVDGVRQPSPVVADVGGADGEECVSLRQRVPIQNYFFVRDLRGP